MHLLIDLDFKFLVLKYVALLWCVHLFPHDESVLCHWCGKQWYWVTTCFHCFGYSAVSSLAKFTLIDLSLWAKLPLTLKIWKNFSSRTNKYSMNGGHETVHTKEKNSTNQIMDNSLVQGISLYFHPYHLCWSHTLSLYWHMYASSVNKMKTEFSLSWQILGTNTLRFQDKHIKTR